MIDESYLENFIRTSKKPSELEHFLHIDRSGTRIDYGSFAGLDEPCCVSLGFIRNDERSAEEVTKVAEILNAHKIPAATGNDVADIDKIQVTPTGIKLPLQSPESSLAMLDDAITALEDNGIKLTGFAHPITASNLVETISNENNYLTSEGIDCSASNDAQAQEILARRETTFAEFVDKQINDAFSSGMSKDAFYNLDKEKAGQSIWRGGTLGNNPYAVVSAVEAKDLVFATPSAYVADNYSRPGDGYKKVNGNSYSFIYEFEMSEHQKFTPDFGIEGGKSGLRLEECLQAGVNAYETMVYHHQNKLKGIYIHVSDFGKGNLTDVFSQTSADLSLSSANESGSFNTGWVGDKYLKIADEKGFISKEWEDFINLHQAKAVSNDPSEIERNNAILAAAKEQKTLSSYEVEPLERTPVNKTKTAQPLTKDDIEAIIATSEHPEEIRHSLSNYFEGLKEPSTVSIGVKSFFEYDGIHTKPDNNIVKIVNLLRENGIDAVPYNSPEAIDTKKFIVDKSGISTPIMSPEDTVKATVDIIDILRENGERVNGYALPKSKESLTYYTNQTSPIIDVVKNNENSPAGIALSARGESISSFISKQLESLSSLQKVDTAAKDNQDDTIVYSGRTCNPYEVISNRRNRDVVYATPSILTAQGYAKGTGGFSTGDYGFIVGYKKAEGQEIYAASEIEIGGKTKGDYETDIFPHRNEIAEIYIVNGNDVYQITDKDGKYISPEWEEFMKLHQGYALADNEIMRQRGNTQKDLMDKDENLVVTAYAKADKLDAYVYDPNISTSDYLKSNFLDTQVTPMPDGKFLVDQKAVFNQNTPVPDCIKDIEFAEMQVENQSISADLSTTKNIFMKNCTLQKGTKLPSEITISNCEINPEIDLSSTVVTLHSADVSNSLEAALSNSHLKTAKEIKVSGCFEIQSPEVLNQVPHIDMSKVELIKLSNLRDYEEISAKTGQKIPCILTQDDDFEKIITIKDAKVQSLTNIGKNNISYNEKIRFEGNCQCGAEFTAQICDNLKRCDFSQASAIEFNCLGDKLDTLQKIDFADNAQIKISGIASIATPSTLAFLEKSNTENLAALMPEKPKEFLAELKEAQQELPNIPLILEEDGIIKIVAESGAREKLVNQYGSNIGKAIYITPQEFTEQTGIRFEGSKEKISNNEAKRSSAKEHILALSGRSGNATKTATVQESPALQKAQEQTAAVQPIKQDEQTATISQPLKPAALHEQKAVAQFSGQKISDLSDQQKATALTKMRVEADNPFSGEGFTAAKVAMSPKTEVRTQTLQNAGTVPQMAFNAAQKDGGMGSR